MKYCVEQDLEESFVHDSSCGAAFRNFLYDVFPITDSVDSPQ